MIKGFIPGKTYRFTGSSGNSLWNSRGLMDAVLDGRPRVCLSGHGRSADFLDTREDPDEPRPWS